MPQIFEDSFSEDLEFLVEKICLENSKCQEKSMKSFQKYMNRVMNTIRAGCKEKMLQEEDAALNDWLFNNYYVFDSNGKELLKQLNRKNRLSCCKEDSLPVLFKIFFEVCMQGSLNIDTESIGKIIELIQSSRYLSNAEFLSLPLIIKAVILTLVMMVAGPGRKDPDASEKIEFAVKGLKQLDNVDFELITETHSIIEKIYLSDPAGIYTQMNKASRREYRLQTARIAKKLNKSEEAVASLAVSAAQKREAPQNHIGWDILHHPALLKQNRDRGRILLLCEIFIPLIATLLLSYYTRNLWVALLTFFPLWEFFRPMIEYCGLKGVPVKYLPRISLENGIPDSAKTLVVISALLTKPSAGQQIEQKMESLYYKNKNKGIGFCFLADLKESENASDPADAACVEAAKLAVETLNRRYQNQFYLIFRKRSFIKTQGKYGGYERKRGAITELIRLIKGKPIDLLAFCGDREALPSYSYLIVLDADTDLLLDTAVEMIGAAIHPLNRPVIDEENHTVKSGYGIIAPKIAVDLNSAYASGFSRIMAGCGGISSYEEMAGELYQDLFNRSIFSGKGILDVNAFYTVLDQRFPDDRILSHDILEGSYLRTGFLSDTEVSDGFPSNAVSWLNRLHRWIRGDWQNIPYLFPSVSGPNGKQKNPIGPLAKFQLFDNLRRSITPVICFLSILLAMFFPYPSALALTIISVLATVFPSLFSAARSVFHGGLFMLPRRYYSKAFPKAMESLLQALVMLILLPQLAATSADAIFRALYRRFFSKKKLLQWVTAAENEAAKRKAVPFKKFALAELMSIALFLFDPYSFIKILCALFIALYPYAYVSSVKEEDLPYQLPQKDRETLQKYAKDMWKFYENTFSCYDNYLPPDNVQEAPIAKTAHRTSPTNIGLMMLSVLAARDMELIDTCQMADCLDKTLSTIEKLDTFCGNLYNWYDTRTLQVMSPKYVSSVDSGNFLCMLLVLEEGIAEYGGEQEKLCKIVERIRSVLEKADLTCFYSPQRKLFSIGYDCEIGKLNDSYYDLLMSESRMLSYYAIASGQVSKKHWGALGRTLSRSGLYTGLVSWTGTMFEYLMSALVLPVYNGSLCYESLKYCLYCQKKRGKEALVPWGMSESGYFAFDPRLNYQYKAHGVQNLALKRNMNQELVVAPYATFLALPYDLEAALKNLSRLKHIGTYGRWGFYEAVDFTSKRIGNGADEVVKSYMAHHVGMSLLAVCNTLCENVMHKRFMKNKQMQSAAELLEERIPSGAVVLNQPQMGRTFIEISKNRSEETSEEYNIITPQTPRVQLLSNTEYTAVITDTGASYALFRGIDIFRRSTDLLRDPCGIFVLFSTKKGVLSATRAPFYSEQPDITADFSSCGVKYRAAQSGIVLTVSAGVHKRYSCELRSVTLKNTASHSAKGSLLIYFEPILIRHEDYNAHPVFSQLFVLAEYDKENNLLIFSRRTRENEKTAFLAVGIKEDFPFDYETQKSSLLKTPWGMESLKDFAGIPFHQGSGTPDCAGAVRLEMDLPPRAEKQLTFLFSVAAGREEAISHLLSVKNENVRDRRLAASPVLSENMESRLAFSILPQLLYGRRDSRENLTAIKNNQRGIEELWELGISGDLPIVLMELHGKVDTSRLKIYLKIQKKLQLYGIFFDIVIGYTQGGDYQQSRLREITDTVQSVFGENVLGQKGGVHPIDYTKCKPEIPLLLKAASRHIVPKSITRISAPAKNFRPLLQLPLIPVKADVVPEVPVSGGFFSGDRFYITEKTSLPWCNILTNPTFGTLVSNTALGFTWAVNARENKLTPWLNNTATDNFGEMLMLRQNDEIYNLINGSLVSFSPQDALYEGTAGSIRVKTRIWVPSAGMAKYCDIELENQDDSPVSTELAYYIEPVLGVNRTHARQISSDFQNNALIMRNPFNMSFHWHLALSSDREITGYTCDRAGFLMGDWNENIAAPVSDPCGAVTVKRELPPKRKEKVRFILSCGKTPESAIKMARLPLPVRSFQQNRITVSTPDKLLNELINTWLPWQILGSRIMGRTGFYQCGGAYGFRDQLQDAGAYLLLSPDICRRHILRCCAVQFEEGDVLHWWHDLPEGIKGVRTRYSDDLLWLPFTVCDYLDKTGDFSLLSVPVAYLNAPELSEGEKERYLTPVKSEVKETVYEHCKKAIAHAGKAGAHGLPLMRGGDWNDGYNNVGEKGVGESVWLAMFLSLVCSRFAAVADALGDSKAAGEFLANADNLKQSVDHSCWDGNWYLRAFYDSGAKMGTQEDDECKIDSLTQSFSALCGMPDKSRVDTALSSVMQTLVDKENGIVRLFTPPFCQSSKMPGYVKSYPKGIRENGGQYTHGAIWYALALYKAGRCDEGYQILSMLNPAVRYDPEKKTDWGKAYKLEPYFIAADIYANQNCYGRGGWSMYTGAAGWYYRTVTEQLLGIRLSGNTLHIEPRVPEHYRQFSMELTFSQTLLAVTVNRTGRTFMTVDGKPADEILLDQKPHTVSVEIS